jgi:hypothetical protein
MSWEGQKLFSKLLGEKLVLINFGLSVSTVPGEFLAYAGQKWEIRDDLCVCVNLTLLCSSLLVVLDGMAMKASR